jgi:hypothetical protein
MMLGLMMALIHRANTSSTDLISNISLLRYTNFTAAAGLEANDTVTSPNWGMMIYHIVNVYPDYLGQVAWVVLFSIPFVMLWLAHADMTAPAVIGVFIGIYVFAFVGSQYMYLGIVFIAISLATLVWSAWQKRG